MTRSSTSAASPANFLDVAAARRREGHGRLQDHHARPQVKGIFVTLGGIMKCDTIAGARIWPSSSRPQVPLVVRLEAPTSRLGKKCSRVRACPSRGGDMADGAQKMWR